MGIPDKFFWKNIKKRNFKKIYKKKGKFNKIYKKKRKFKKVIIKKWKFKKIFKKKKINEMISWQEKAKKRKIKNWENLIKNSKRFTKIQKVFK